MLDTLAQRPGRAALLVGVGALLVPVAYLAVAGAFETFPKAAYPLWLAWFLIMAPGITLLTKVVPGTLSPPAVTLLSLAFGAALWSSLTYAFLRRVSRRAGDAPAVENPSFLKK